MSDNLKLFKKKMAAYSSFIEMYIRPFLSFVEFAVNIIFQARNFKAKVVFENNLIKIFSTKSCVPKQLEQNLFSNSFILFRKKMHFKEKKYFFVFHFLSPLN